MNNTVKKVIIISPPAKKIIEPNYDRPEFPRPALAYLKTYISQKINDICIDALDCKFERLNTDQTVSTLIDSNYDLICITAFTSEINSAIELAKKLKENPFQGKIMIGGVHATALPMETMEESINFDYLIAGEGEKPLLEFINTINQGEELNQVSGLIYRENNKIIKSLNFHLRYSVFSEIDKPDWSWFKRKPTELRVMAQKGCPYTCDFCANPNGRKTTKRQVDGIVSEISEFYENFGVTKISFDDEIFGLDTKYSVELINKIDQLNIPSLHISIMAHARCMNKKLAEAFGNFNGNFQIGLGMETGDEVRLKEIGKSLSKDIVNDAVNRLKKFKNISIEGLFIIGHPRENFRSALSSIFFAASLNIDIAVFGIMVPYPGTQIWKDMKDNKNDYRMILSSWDEFNKQISSGFELKNFKRWQLEFLQFFGYNYFFLKRLKLLSWAKFIYVRKHEIFFALRNFLGNVIYRR